MKNIFFLLLLSACAFSSAQTIKDLIQPVSLEEAKTSSFVVSDLFYTDGYKINLLPNENVTTALNKGGDTIVFTPNLNFTGLDLISFKLNDEVFQIPVKLDKKEKYLFTYKPDNQVNSVNLFGQFNGWDRNNLPMKDENNDGTYEINIPLDAGRYEYKFFVDGKELVDSQNPIKVPNGMGDYNSVRIIEQFIKEIFYLHILEYQKKSNSISLSYFCEKLNKKSLLNNEIIALLDNKVIDSSNVEIAGNKIILMLDQTLLAGRHAVRVAVSENGRASNIQTVFIENGIPCGKEKFQNWNDAVIYSLMVDRFYDGDKSNSSPIIHPELSIKANYNGGDLQGIIDKIEEGYFEQLGVNTLWLTPVVDNTDSAYKEYPPPHRYYTGYHGYWPVASENVEQRFGNLELLKKLTDTAHKHGLKILLDFVAHHVHIENPLWNEHRNWFGKLELPDGRLNLRLWDEFRLTTWFEPYMPSFDFVGSIEAREFMTNNALWWLKESGADGFRHDAVKHVPNEFWRLLSKKIKQQIELPQNKKVYQIGETFGSYNLISSYVNNGQLDAQFNFNLYDTAINVFLDSTSSFSLLNYQLQKTFSVYGVNNLMANIMDSHDKIRYMAYADGDLQINDGSASEIGWTNPPTVDNASSYQKLKLYLAYELTIPGVPIIYYGDEIGMTGASDPDNRRMMRFDNDLLESEKETFGDISKLIDIRNKNSALRYGDFLTLLADENIFAYVRSDMNQRVLVILNKNNKSVTVDIELPPSYNVSEAIDLVNGQTFKINKNRLVSNVNSISYLIFIIK